jgi:hypothetical protein
MCSAMYSDMCLPHSSILAPRRNRAPDGKTSLSFSTNTPTSPVGMSTNIVGPSSCSLICKKGPGLWVTRFCRKGSAGRLAPPPFNCSSLLEQDLKMFAEFISAPGLSRVSSLSVPNKKWPVYPTFSATFHSYHMFGELTIMPPRRTYIPVPRHPT